MYSYLYVCLISLLPLTAIGQESNDAPKSLEGMQFFSEFYHYVNFYNFQTGSTGYSEDGQLFWSTGLDTTGRSSAEDSVIYSFKEQFEYTIEDNTLTIRYISSDHSESDATRVFFFRPKRNDWISEYEYTYGKEVLVETAEKILIHSWF